MYLKWRDAQRSGYGGSLEEYAEYRERRALGCNAQAWKAWEGKPEKIVLPRPRMSQDEQRRYWRRYQRLRRFRDADKNAARRYVQRRVETGKMSKPDRCKRCSARTPRHLLHGHHYQGYDGIAKAIIEWLCPPCHVIEEGGWGASLHR